MPRYLKWNKNRTKVKVWSTISDGWLTRFLTPEQMMQTEYRDMVVRDYLNECPCCASKLSPRVRSDYEKAVLKEI